MCVELLPLEARTRDLRTIEAESGVQGALLIRKISIIIPTLHEADGINAALDRLERLNSPVPFEIIVVDGAEEADTLAAIRARNIVRIRSDRGRARQMNAGAAAASGDVLIFLHADTLLPRNGLQSIAELMALRNHVAGAFSLGVNSARAVFRITEQYAALRTRVTRIPFGDQAIFMRKEYFEKLGGYRDIPVMEDVEIMRRIKKRKDRLCILDDKVLTSARRWEREGVVCCTLRNWLLQALYAFGVPPERLAKLYK